MAHWKTWLALIALVVGAPLAGCELGEEEPEIDGEIQPIGGATPNSLPTDVLVGNALLGSYDSLVALSSKSLSTATFATDPGVIAAMTDAKAKQFLPYLVSTALAQGQTLKVGSTTYQGLVGACPSWNSGPPSAACLRCVSAMLLLRNNALGKFVTVFARGAACEGVSEGNLTPQPSVSTVKIDSAGATMTSFKSCLLANLLGDTHNCGWAPAYVGTCTAGSTVIVSAGVTPPASCAAAADSSLMVRVCTGYRGCNYSSRLTDGCSKPEVSQFTCPSNGTFSVMTRPYNNTPTLIIGGPPPPPRIVEAFNERAYPAAEADVFTFHEGAAYGTLFDYKGREYFVEPIGVEGETAVYDRFGTWMFNDYVGGEDDRNAFFSSVKGSINRYMYCTPSTRWTWGVAYMLHRTCMATEGLYPSEGKGCACVVNGTSTAPPTCTADGSGGYSRCNVGIKAWNEPIASYLNHRNDIVSGDY